jgi:hypothetical protein
VKVEEDECMYRKNGICNIIVGVVRVLEEEENFISIS